MRAICTLLVLGFGAGWLHCPLCDAGEPDAAIECVLARWEEASQECQSLDTKLTILRYDDVFGGDQPTIMEGRFYYEAPHVGRYEMRDCTHREDLSEAVVWNGKTTLCITGRTRSCTRFSTEGLRQFPKGWLRQITQHLQAPEQFLPLVVKIHAAEVKERFDVKVDRSAERIMLKAVPKQESDKTVYSEIDVILNTKTYMTCAIQIISLGGRDRTVYVLSEQKVNQRPSDRKQLLEPDLSGYRVTEAL